MKINADLPVPTIQNVEAVQGPADKTFGLGRVLHQVRLRRDLSQQELADMVGLTRTSVCNIELGKQSLQLGTLIAMAEAMGMEVEVNIRPKEGVAG